MDGRNDKPVPPWEREQAAAVLAELKQEQEFAAREQEALKPADASLLIAEVDRMIAERKIDIERMNRLDATQRNIGGGQVPGLRFMLYSLDKPGCIVVLLVLIVAMGIALHFMANSLSASIARLPQQQTAPTGDPIDFSDPDNDQSSLKGIGVDPKTAEEDVQDAQQPDQSSAPIMP